MLKIHSIFNAIYRIFTCKFAKNKFILKHKKDYSFKLLNNSNISLALILGSGVELDENLISDKSILFEDKTGVHHKLIYRCIFGGKDVLVFKGRRHYYEGWSLEEITSNIKTAEEYGVKNILVTNAAGGLNENFRDGELMLITSHINFIDKLKFNNNHINRNYYSKELKAKLLEACSTAKVKIHEGTYGCYTGPTYETKAEIRMQKKIKLDAAGMSTVPEVIFAAAKNLNVIAVSVITNLLRENSEQFTSHEDVLLTASMASKSLNKVLPVFINQLN